MEPTAGRNSSAAEARDYGAWKARNAPDDVRRRSHRTALEDVRRARPAVEARFERDWGMLLPEEIFTFRAFLRALTPEEQRAMRDLDLHPFGLMDLFDDPHREARPGLDVRVHGRYYRDPPEFVTFMHGGTDGLHFGLWFDDGRTCTGVAGYYNNDGGGVGIPGGTPLREVRRVLERRWRDLGDEDADATGPLNPDRAPRAFRLRLLRETLVSFEPDDVTAEGEAYHRADWERLPRELRAHGDPRRIATLDGAGALVTGRTALDRAPQLLWDDHDFCTGLWRVLTGDRSATDAAVAEAKRRCAAGDPAEALVLGRDLHWASGSDPDRERQAGELLTMAYRTLGRPALAAIADAHHRHRDLPSVAVLAG
ncbi:hypothetical protein [Marinactinospora rubrisoli]|uniref:DUF2228 domain-containing protein n=1 Tax=Marinactinospora rubrisoli TaxID=2715399 RepID=A0ABW2K8E5_9ACTN